MKLGKKLISLGICFVILFGTVAVSGSIVSAEEGTAYKTGDFIYYGSYPQTDVTNSMGSTLNYLASNWESYNYYSGPGNSADGQMTASDYMRYCDVNLGGNKYRGVVFDSYRPCFTEYTSSTGNTYQDDNGYTTGTTYWFKYEPLRWRVLDASTGLVVCETIIDSQPYNNYYISNGKDSHGREAYWGDSAQTYYASDYENSSIRKWLNEDFYTTAFNQSQQLNIKTTTLNNDGFYTLNEAAGYEEFDSKSTSDKIFLLSWDEVVNSNYGFSTIAYTCNTARQAKGSDYAKCQGLDVYNSSGSSCDGCSYWRLRSPGGGSSYSCSVDLEGCVCNILYRTHCTFFGVRPAMCLQNLESESFEPESFHSEFSQQHTVSNYAAKYLSYGVDYPGIPMDGTNGNPDYCIPGLSKNDNMTPQGMTYYAANDWILISAYNPDKSHTNVIFALDASTGSFVAQFNVYNADGTKNISHIGGIAASGNNLYLTDNNSSISYIPLSEITYTGSEKDVTIAGTASLKSKLNGAETSYLSYGDDCIWTGNFYYAKKDGYNKKASETNNSLILGFSVSGSNSYEEWNNLNNFANAKYTYKVPDTIDKIQCAVRNEGKLCICSSYGRTSNSTLYYCDTEIVGETIDSAASFNKKTILPMSEGMFIKDGCLYTLYESACYKYRNGDNKGYSMNPTDVIWKMILSVPEQEKNDYSIKTNSATDISYKYQYNDSYFAGSSDVYSTKLMQASMCLAVASMVDDGGNYSTKEPGAARKMFSDLGYEGYSHYGYQEKPASSDPDSAACTMAYKNVDGSTIIAVSVRGSGYEGEWGSNFNVGSSSDANHVGFNKASNYVLGYLNQFVTDNRAKFNNKIKFWITGYSRAAAVANLVAASLNKGVPGQYNQIKSLNYSKDSIFAYTFETPQNTTDKNSRSADYNNIFNIVNRIDPVTMVAPSAWGFSRYGRDYYLPSAESTAGYSEYRKIMSSIYKEVTQGDTYEEDFVYAYLDIDLIKYCTESNQLIYVKENKTITQGVYLDMLFDVLANDIICGRNDYSKNYQASMTKFFKKYPLAFGDLPSTDILWNNIKNNVDWKTVLSLYFNNSDLSKTLRPVLSKSISDWLSDAGVTYDEAYDLLSIVDNAVIAIIDNLDVLVSALYNNNGTRLFIPHYPCTTFSWVMACPELITENRTYTKAKFNCPVDIRVYDSTDKLAVAIINNEPQYIEGSTISAYVDKDGQKTFCLPSDEQYRFEITGNDKGTMTCSFSDYDFSTNTELNITNYYDIPVDTETEISALVEEKECFEEALSVKMSEYDKEMSPSETIDDGTEATYAVSVVAESNTGVVRGGGKYIKGEFAKATAYCSDNNTFLGWYISDKLVSEENEYRFMVDKDITVVGKFAEKSTAPDNQNNSDKPAKPDEPDKPEESTVPAEEPSKPDFSGFKIKNYSLTLSVDYKSTVIFHTTMEAPDGYEIVWSNGAKGSECKLNSVTDKEYKISAKMVNKATGETEAVTEEVTVKVNTSFFAKIIAFFKGLFGSLPTYEDFKKQ